MPNDIKELVEKFNDANGNRKYSERDLLKYIISRLDILDSNIDKVKGSLNNKIDNHITTNENRLTKVETNLGNIKWMTRALITGIIGLTVGIIVLAVKTLI